MAKSIKCLAFVFGSALAADLKLATFDGAEGTTASWKDLNDPVMGGASTSTFKVTADKTGVFDGKCAIVGFLKAPGFAKVVGAAKFGDMTGYDNIAMRVRSSTPGYQGFKVAFASPGVPKTSMFGGGSYKAGFNLTGGDWQVVEVPLTQFSYDWSGYTGRCDTKDPGHWYAKGVQHYCCDKSGIQPSKPQVCVDSKYLSTISSFEVWAEGVVGDFNIEIEWIGASKKSDMDLQAAKCTGSGDPGTAPGVFTGPMCYEGAAGAFGLKETVDVKIESFASSHGLLDLTGKGITGITCTKHFFSKNGQAITTDLGDCLPKTVKVEKVNYCSDQDAIQVTVKDTKVPIPITATLQKIKCPSLETVAPKSPSTEGSLLTFDGAAGTTFEFTELNDPVMGGQSSGTWSLKDGAGVIDGEVKDVPSLKAPGFIKAAGAGKFADISEFIDGSLVLKVRSSTPEYAGFRVSFAAGALNNAFACGGGGSLPLSRGCFKQKFSVPAGSDFVEVKIPFNTFSDKWSPATGEHTKECTAADKDVCPSAERLRKIERMEFWAEGANGKLHLEIQSVSAEKASGEKVFLV